MILTLERFHSTHDATLGILWLNCKFECFTLEDEYRPEKVASDTRIPEGKYRIRPRTAGGMIQRYKERFPWHKGMLWLQDVQGFEWIYIHVGNTDADTEGCILVGSGCDPDKMRLHASVPAYERLYDAVYAAAEAGVLEIEIIDRDIRDTVVFPHVTMEELGP